MNKKVYQPPRSISASKAISSLVKILYIRPSCSASENVVISFIVTVSAKFTFMILPFLSFSAGNKFESIFTGTVTATWL